MSYDIPSISELEAIQLLNKHYAEVVTSKKDGIASGLDITQTTNPITSVTRRTLYKILDDMDDMFLERLLKMSFTPVGTFTGGATLTDARQTLLWEVSQGGDGHYYSWGGSFPKVVTAGSTPSPIAAGSWVDRTDDTLRDEIRETVFQNMKRSYAEAGFNLVDGSFQLGGVLSGWPDVLWDWATGKGYQWHLDEAKTVAAGSTPENIGIDWIDVSGVLLKEIVNVLLERNDGITDLQNAIDTGQAFIRYIGDGTSVTIPSMATIFIKNMKGAELTFTLGVGASVIQYMPDGTVTETRNVNTIVLPESHSSATMSTSQIELKNDFIDYGDYLKITGESFDSIQLKRGDYTIDSSCVGTFPDPFHKDGKLTVDIISNSVGSQTFKSNYGATFQRRWRILNNQPSFNVWICTSFGTILQQPSYPTAGQNFRNYTTAGTFRFNDTSPINSPLGPTIPAIGELTVKAATSSGLLYQQFTYKYLLTPMAFECIYNGTTWTNWIPVSPDVIYYPNPVVNEAFSFNAIKYHVNIRVNTGSTTPSDGPFGAPCFGRLKVETDYLNYVFQEFKEMGGTNRIAVRSSSNNGSTWTAWRTI